MITPIVSGLIYSANRRAVLEVIPPGLRKLWKDWDLRLAVLISLIVQILLTIFGNRRKYNGKLWVRALVWSAYTAAETITTFGLGIISNDLSYTLDNKGNDGRLDPNIELKAVWAQFLFLHLGGPDSITAYALEDNELWKRQLLGLVTQTFGAIYVFLLALTGKSLRLSILSVLIFIVGFIKYGERTWVLKAARNQLYRKSVLSNNSINRKGLEELELPRHRGNYTDKGKLLMAYGLLAGTRRLFVDAALMPLQRDVMKAALEDISVESAFEVNEIQLGMIYDLLYSKGLLLFSTKGLPLRLITFSISCSWLVFFLWFIDDKHKYSKIDLFITFALLIVSVLLEIYAALVLLSSDWCFVWLAKKGIKISTITTLTSFPPFKIPRWSNNMGQYTLLRFLSKGKPLLSYGRFLKIGTGNYCQWDTQVNKDLRALIFMYFKKKANELQSMAKNKVIMPFIALPTTTNQGEELQEEDQLPPDVIDKVEEQLNGTTEFEYKIVIWSIATEVMYCLDQKYIAEDFLPKCEAITLIARYMLYLLVKHPSVISAETDIMNLRFEDITETADNFVPNLIQTKFCVDLRGLFRPKWHLIEVEKWIVIYKAAKIVAKKKALQETDESLRNKWNEVGDFWLEMLAYSANRCTGTSHAQKLRYGGEFLTHVWLLMAHFGLTRHHFQSFPEIKMDDPYGAPAPDYETYQVLLLIGLGIGGTPMISIVEDIINNLHKKPDNLISALKNGNYEATTSSPTFRTKKAYFYWVTNNERSFDWFNKVMKEVAKTDERRVIELHNYHVDEERDAKKGVDAVLERRVKCHFTKPNWDQVFRKIANNHINSKIGVFCYGPPATITELRQVASDFSRLNVTDTRFEVHKVNF